MSLDDVDEVDCIQNEQELADLRRILAVGLLQKVRTLS